MRLIEHRLRYEKRGTTFRLYPFGDVHWGARACDEEAARDYLARLAADPYGIGLLGGDLFEAIPQTDPRFDRETLAGWCKDARDVMLEQKRYAEAALAPVKDKLIGGIEGNHERVLRDKQGRDLHGWLCETLGIPDLTYSAFIRLVFHRKSPGQRSKAATTTFLIHAAHGKQAGGVLAGSERNRLGRRLERIHADLCLVGHSHWREVLDDTQKLTAPRHGRLPEQCTLFRPQAANWGTYYRTAPVGPSTYAERAEYHPKDIGGVIVEFTPDTGEMTIDKVRKERKPCTAY